MTKGGIRPAERARFEAGMNRFLAVLLTRTLVGAVARTARAGAEAMREDVRVDTGATKESISVAYGAGGLTAQVSVGGAAVFQEFGTRPHVILPRTASVLVFKINGETVYAMKVNHPGSPKAPFVRPAADEMAALIILEIKNAVRSAAATT